MNTVRLPYVSKIKYKGKTVCSDYQLLGNDENALTLALGHCMSHEDKFLAAFLRWCGFKGVRSVQTRNAEISIQKYQENEGITDLEIEIPDRIHLIIEAKIGGGIPKECQIDNYIKRLKNTGSKAKVVILTKVKNNRTESTLRKKFGKRVEFRTWSGVMELARKLLSNSSHNDSTFKVHSFYGFMKEVYNMSIDADVEVWIVSLSTKWKAKSEDISVADLHVKHCFWVMGPRRAPRALYMGFRYNGHLQYIGRIKRIDYGLKSSQIGPKIATEFWEKKYEPYNVIRLEKLIPFPKKLPSGNLHSRHVYCDIDFLLTADTIIEAERLTKKRREKINSR